MIAAVSEAATMMGLVAQDPSPAAPLVGRTAELTRLAALVGLAGSGRAASGPVDAVDGRAPADGIAEAEVVLLAGDAGIGKTRLLAELRDRALTAGWRVVVGHCVDLGEGTPPYLPFGELFARLQRAAPELAATLDAAYPPLSRLLRVPGAGDADGRIERAELFAAVHGAFEDAARDAPLLVLLEDVHWADRSTRDLLTYLFTRGLSGPTRLVASYRSDDLHRRHPLRATAGEWSRLPGVERVELPPLPDAAVLDLVRQLHPGPLADTDLDAVVRRAEGNAFFAEELVAAAERSPGAVPRDLAGLLLLRLDQLDPAARAVVRAASVAGRQVPHALLAQVAGLDGPVLDEALRTAVERHVLVPLGGEGYAFRHALLAEAVYDDLLPGERVRLHAAYVAALDPAVGSSALGSPPGTAAVLARHARAAYDDATALRASVRAGAEALALGGPDEALRHDEIALELAAEALRTTGSAPVDVVALTVDTSTAAIAAGQIGKAVALVEDQLAQLPPATHPLDRARLLLALATALLLLDSTQEDVLLRTAEVLELVPADPPTELRARALGVHAEALMDFLRDDIAVGVATEARDVATTLGLVDVAADASTTLARLQERGGDPAASRAELERLATAARARGDAVELRALHHLAGLQHELGELTDALATYRHASARAAELGRPWSPYGLYVRTLWALTAYETGHWDDDAPVADLRADRPPPLATALLEAAGLAVAAGRGESAAAQRLPELRPWWAQDGLVAVLSATAGIDLHGDAGDLEAAIALHDDAVATLSELWHWDFQGRLRFSALLLGQLSAAVPRTGADGRAELAARGRELAGAAEEVADPGRRRPRRPGPEAVAWAARAAAEDLRLRWLTGVDRPDGQELVRSWEAAVVAFERWPHPFERARSQARLSAVLRASGDAAGARLAGDQARATAHRLGAAPLLAELRAAGSTPAPGAAEPSADALTPREREVLGLVAEGRSNREIGQRLYISAKTVSVHVSNVLAKLDAAGRTEAVALARHRGLLD